MFLKSRTSPIALAAAFAFAMGSTAFAATMVGDQEISDADLAMVTAHCASLTSDTAATDGATDLDQDTTAAVPPANSGTPDTPATSDGPASSDMSNDSGATDTDDLAADSAPADDSVTGEAVDLAAITAADCEAAGL